MRQRTLDTVEFNHRPQFNLVFSSSFMLSDVHHKRLRRYTAFRLDWFQSLRDKGLDLNQLVHTDGSAMLLDIFEYMDRRLPRDKQMRVFEVKLYWMTVLLLNGANASVCDRYGRNALHIIVLKAIRLEKMLPAEIWDHELVHKYVEFICASTTTLMSFGCDPMAEDQNGECAAWTYINNGYSSLVFACGLHALSLASSRVAEFSRFVSSKVWNVSVPANDLPASVRKRNAYTSIEDDPNAGRSTCFASTMDYNPKLPPRLAEHSCEADCPYEWPISWRLFRHARCPKSCTDTIVAGYNPEPRQVLLSAYYQGKDWRKIAVQKADEEKYYQGGDWKEIATRRAKKNTAS